MKNTEVNRAKGRKADAFTLIEIMVVLTILAALMGMGFVGYRKIRENADVRATKVLVEAVANGISQKGTTAGVRSGYDAQGKPTLGASVRELVLWDCNKDGYVDGRLTVTSTGSAGDDEVTPGAMGFGSLNDASGALSAAKYAGFASSGIEVSVENNIDPQGRPMDAWQRPLRYAYLPLTGVSGSKSADTSYLSTGSPNYTSGSNLQWIRDNAGSKRFVVWSDGPDGVAFTADDIASTP